MIRTLAAGLARAGLSRVQRVWLVWWAVCVVGCSDGDPCGLERIIDCPSCGTGEVRHAFAAHWQGRDRGAVFRSGEDIVFASCSTLTHVDKHGDVRGHDKIALPDEASILVGAGDAQGDAYLAYEVVTNIDDPDRTESSLELLALDATAERRWETHIGGFRWQGVTPSLALLFMYPMSAGPEGTYLHGNAYAADDGAVRETYIGVREPDGTGGVFAATLQDELHFVLDHTDATGAARWSKPLAVSADPGALGRMLIVNALGANGSGGVAVVGWFQGLTLDLGDTQLSSPSANERHMFVAMIDASGTTSWAHVLGVPHGNVRVAAHGDEVVVGSGYDDDGTSFGLPPTTDEFGKSFLAIIDESGVERAYDIRNLALLHVDELDQFHHDIGGWHSIIPADDGSVWLVAEPSVGPFTIGATTFPTSGTYLLNFVP